MSLVFIQAEIVFRVSSHCMANVGNVWFIYLTSIKPVTQQSFHIKYGNRFMENSEHYKNSLPWWAFSLEDRDYTGAFLMIEALNSESQITREPMP